MPMLTEARPLEMSYIAKRGLSTLIPPKVRPAVESRRTITD